MIKTLRKKHLQIWSLWAILLPAGIISAYVSIPQQRPNKLLQESSTYTLPVLLKTIDNLNYSATLRRSKDSSQLQLEWKNKTASIYPSSLIYQFEERENDIKNAGIIGRVEARGQYYFSLKKSTGNIYRFVLYDIIHEQKIDSINFYP